jgi:hypothetical protein
MMVVAVVLVVFIVAGLVAAARSYFGATTRRETTWEHLPVELQHQELDRRAFHHGVRSRAVLDAALHEIQQVAREQREDR